MQKNIVLLHGWGFDKNFWLPLINECNFKNIINIDSGYFSFYKKEQIKSNAWIGIAHSLGYAKMITKFNLNNCLGIINICGFENLNSKKRIIKKMIDKIKINPKNVLCEFYKNSNFNEKNINLTYINLDKLLSDLEYMHSLEPNNNIIKIPIMSIYIEDDMIVPKNSMIKPSTNHKIILFERGGHASVYNNPKIFKNHILDFILQRSNNIK